MPAASPGTEGLPHAMGRVASTLVDITRSRLELASLELEEERLRLAALALAASCTLFSAFTGSVLLAGWVVYLLDGAHRPLAAGVITALFVLAALAGAWQWHKLASRQPGFLAATLDELRRDSEALANEALP